LRPDRAQQVALLHVELLHLSLALLCELLLPDERIPVGIVAIDSLALQLLLLQLLLCHALSQLQLIEPQPVGRRHVAAASRRALQQAQVERVLQLLLLQLVARFRARSS
jgi:hypothetical protein